MKSISAVQIGSPVTLGGSIQSQSGGNASVCGSRGNPIAGQIVTGKSRGGDRTPACTQAPHSASEEESLICSLKVCTAWASAVCTSLCFTVNRARQLVISINKPTTKRLLFFPKLLTFTVNWTKGLSSKERLFRLEENYFPEGNRHWRVTWAEVLENAILIKGSSFPA